MTDLKWALEDLPYLVGDLPGIGGRIRQSPEDFVVEEIPAYRPEGVGEFLYLWIEKRGLSAEQLMSHVARLLRISLQDVGMAGLKDRHAATRQYISVPFKCEPRLKDLDHPQITVLEVGRHKNKLRPGHLRGNRFTIVVRDVVDDALDRAVAIAGRIRTFGMPNYFGEQRFGRDNETLVLGLDLLRGTKTPADIPRVRRKFLLRLALSAVQSALFNRSLSNRINSGQLFQVELGDVMQVVASGGPFVVEDVAREQPRFSAQEIVIAGPMFGPKMKPSAGSVKEQEESLLTEAGLSRDDFTKYPLLTSGTRRAFLVWPDDLTVNSVSGGGVEVAFGLPSGSYATVLLREMMQDVTATAKDSSVSLPPGAAGGADDSSVDSEADVETPEI
ncbi:MAG: tRNA pseudouridine(13) synthase TruD [Planctomycetota bacterium]|nr:tRNA pseudouridine(13) synthase TruD [Planctomycetota bacterium]